MHITTHHSKSRNGKAGGAPPGNKNALKHGLPYKATLNGPGLDERTSLFKALREKEQEPATALGGDPSPQEQVIIADSQEHALHRETGSLTSTNAQPCGSQSLTANPDSSKRCSNPFCRYGSMNAKQRKKFCCDRCRTDGYVLRRANAMVDAICILEFNAILQRTA